MISSSSAAVPAVNLLPGPPLKRDNAWLWSSANMWAARARTSHACPARTSPQRQGRFVLLSQRRVRHQQRERSHQHGSRIDDNIFATEGAGPAVGQFLVPGMTTVQMTMLAGLPYTALRDAVIWKG